MGIRTHLKTSCSILKGANAAVYVLNFINSAATNPSARCVDGSGARAAAMNNAKR